MRMISDEVAKAGTMTVTVKEKLPTSEQYKRAAGKLKSRAGQSAKVIDKKGSPQKPPVTFSIQFTGGERVDGIPAALLSS